MTYGFRHHLWTGSIGEPSRSTKGARTAVTFLFLRPLPSVSLTVTKMPAPALFSRSISAAVSREKVSDQVLGKERSFFPSPNVWKVKTLSPQSPPHNASKNRFVSRQSKLRSSSSLVMLILPPHSREGY